VQRAAAWKAQEQLRRQRPPIGVFRNDNAVLNRPLDLVNADSAFQQAVERVKADV
jgi:hypothetical protein